MNYAKSLRILRAARGISQQDLALLAGLSKSLISKIESGARDMSKDIKATLAENLKVPESLIDILAIEPQDSKLGNHELERIGKELLAIQSEIGTYEKKVQD